MDYDFRDRLREIMKRRGYDDRKLEERTGISRRTYANWKNGRYPNSNILIQLADELRVSADELLGLNTVHNLLDAALDDAKLMGCETCQHGRRFGGCKAVCARQDDGMYPRQGLTCWEWRGFVNRKEDD